MCDKITVLRDGGLVGEYAIKDLPRVQLVSKMLGKELDDLSDIKGEQKADQKAESTEPYSRPRICAVTPGSSLLISISKG